MLIVALLDGYSSSVSGYKTGDVIAENLNKWGITDYLMKDERSKIFDRKGHEAILRFIFSKESPNNTLLCVGKSFGAKRMIQHVLNRLALRPSKLKYKEVFCLTIDPNWPTWRDLSPNLNNRKLYLKYPVDNFYNVYVVGDKRQQSGAKVFCKYCINETDFGHNVPVYFGYDHYSIINSRQVKNRLAELVGVTNG